MLHFSTIVLVIEFWTTELIFKYVLINVTPRKSQYFKVRFVDDQWTELSGNSARNAVWRHLIHLTDTWIVLEKLTKKLHFPLSGGNKNILLFFSVPFARFHSSLAALSPTLVNVGTLTRYKGMTFRRAGYILLPFSSEVILFNLDFPSIYPLILCKTYHSFVSKQNRYYRNCLFSNFEKLCNTDFRLAISDILFTYLGADKSLARPGRKQATATKSQLS